MMMIFFFFFSFESLLSYLFFGIQAEIFLKAQIFFFLSFKERERERGKMMINVLDRRTLPAGFLERQPELIP